MPCPPTPAEPPHLCSQLCLHGRSLSPAGSLGPTSWFCLRLREDLVSPEAPLPSSMARFPSQPQRACQGSLQPTLRSCENSFMTSLCSGFSALVYLLAPYLSSACCTPDPRHSNRNAKIVKTWPCFQRRGTDIQCHGATSCHHQAQRKRSRRKDSCGHGV